jgi:hypothetical protein
MSEPSTIEQLGLALGRALTPLGDRLASDPIGFFEELGLKLPPSLLTHGNFSSAVQQADHAIGELPELISHLANAIEAEETTQILTVGAQLLKATGAGIAAFTTIAEALDALANELPGVEPADVAAFAGELAERLLDYALIEYMEGYYQLPLRVATAIGVVDYTWVGAAAGKPAHLRRELRLDRLPALLQEPLPTIAGLYGWGTPTPDTAKALEAIYAIMRTVSLPVALRRDGSGTVTGLELLVAKLSANPATSPPGLLAELRLGLAEDLRAGFPLSEQWSIGVELDGHLEGGLSAELVPPANVALHPPAGELDGKAMIGLYGGPAAGQQKLYLLGAAGGTRIEAATIVARAGAAFKWDSASNAAKGELALEAQIAEARAVLDLGGADGFLGTLLSAAHVEVPFDATLGWQQDRGLYFEGSASLEIDLPLHLDLGPINLQRMHVAVGPHDGALVLAPSISGDAELGPLTASVDRVGIELKLRPEPGNLGPVDLGFGFKPPNGVGLAVDAGVVKGGGYLFFDTDKEEYAGVLELSLEDIVQIKAIGLITTKMPDGSHGFSLLLILTAEFPPIQLSFGFTLNGVGGLAGVNRTMNTDALRAGLRHHTLDSILFPSDPVARAAEIISDLRTVFPPASGRYVFGPMLEIGWGTPTLITASLGVILELPEPIRLAILGQIKATLPTEDAALVQLHLDVIGIIDFEKKSLSIDATLYESRVLIYELDGDMALRLGWGENPNFALSVGGLHPRFPPPPGFPELHRLSLSMGDGDNPRLSCQTYWAITSNSVQTGARLELYASAAGFTVHGWLGFDVLVILSPFSFEASMDAGVDLLSGSSVLMSIHLSFILSGPTPWRARGSASVDILFFSVSVDFDVSWGDDHPATLPAADALGPLLEALRDARSWQASLPEGCELGASLGSVPAPKEAVLAHPLGRLAVREKAVPLDLPLSRFGSGVPDHWNQFAITAAALNGKAATTQIEEERFARGQFQALPDADKLSKPSFEQFHAGVSFGSTDALHGHVSNDQVHFETFVVDDVEKPSRFFLLYAIGAAAFAGQIGLSSAALSPVLLSGNGKYVEPDMRGSIKAGDVAHVIASTEDLSVRDDLLAFGGSSMAAAELALAAHLAANPGDAGTLQVMPAYEAVAA